MKRQVVSTLCRSAIQQKALGVVSRAHAATRSASSASYDADAAAHHHAALRHSLKVTIIS